MEYSNENRFTESTCTSKYLKKKMNKQSKLQRNTQYNIVYEDEKLENNASEKLSV